jgi:hypothetical protein
MILIMSCSFFTTLHDAYARVTMIELLSPSASPRMASAYQRTLAKVNQYTGQMSAHIQGIAMATPPDPDDGTRDWLDDGSGDWGEHAQSFYNT